MGSSDSYLASCSGVVASGLAWSSEGSRLEGSAVLSRFGELLGVLAAGSGSLFSPPVTAIGSSLPSPFLLPSNATFAFRPVTPG